jgi:ABC-type multidrug transport system fused ATPase/permease subunit
MTLSLCLNHHRKQVMLLRECSASLDTIDDAVLERAIRAEGLTPADFAAANKVTVSDAARIMQQYSRCISIDEKT